MSVLNCPVCRGAMKETTKNNVSIDICTQCRGVWLDRGELEKLMDGIMPERNRHDNRQSYIDHDDDDDDYRYRERSHGHGHKKRSKLSTFMEIFD